MKKIHFKNKEEFIEFYVDFFQLLYFITKQNKRVTKRLREFLIKSVIMLQEGWDLDSAEGVLEIADRMNFRNKDEVYNYRKKLKERGLMVQTRDSLKLPMALHLPTVLPSAFSFRI